MEDLRSNKSPSLILRLIKKTIISAHRLHSSWRIQPFTTRLKTVLLPLKIFLGHILFPSCLLIRLPRLVTLTAAAPARMMCISVVTATVRVHPADPNTSRTKSGTARGATSGPWTGLMIPAALSVDVSATSIATSSTRRARSG